MPIQYVTNNAGVRTLVHGMASAMELKALTSWRACKNRCRKTKHSAVDPILGCYRHVTVCERWMDSFENFLADMGLPPSEIHSLERKDGKLGYSPENCIWATPSQQAINRSSTQWITIRGEKKPLCEWSRLSGVPATTLMKRIKRHGQVEEVLKPVGQLQWKSMRMVTINGRTQHMSAWAREIGCTQEALHYRIKRGYSQKELIEGRPIGRPVGSKATTRALNKPDSPLDTRASAGPATEQ